ncbi:MAG: hypothetical protein KC766_07900 [Myxococcales bacterium]|nr:hypothetical protein [Myxococcales bacterium]
MAASIVPSIIVRAPSSEEPQNFRNGTPQNFRNHHQAQVAALQAQLRTAQAEDDGTEVERPRRAAPPADDDPLIYGLPGL